MRTTVDIPQALFDQVIRETGQKSKRKALVVALEEFLRQKKKRSLMESRGKLRINLDIRKSRRDRDLG